MDKVIRRVVVHGRVQGVGYRAWTQYKARQRNLDGWVRNRRDGTVWKRCSPVPPRLWRR